MAAFVALIRGVNLGPNKKVPMAELRKALADDGFENVRTILASGNVVLDGGRTAAEVERRVAKVIAVQFGHDVDVMVRDAEQIAGVIEANPFEELATDGSRYFVSFLSGKPEKLPDEDFGEERFELRGSEIYVWCPGGLRDSKAFKALDERRLGVRATVRNWNTVTKVHALLND